MKRSIRRRLIQAIDRPGGRWLLGALATQYARLKSGLDCRVFYDEAWLHSINGTFIVDGAAFDYLAAQMANWQAGLNDILEPRRDWWFHQYRPQPGDTVVDIGAGVGEDTLLFAKTVGPTGHVWAIEAHPKTFRHLQKTIQWNALHNVTPVACAISDQRGVLYIEDRAAYQANTIHTTPVAGQSPTSVPAVTLDEFCAQQHIDHIDFLKMNIEGAEQLAIRGLTRMLPRTRFVCIACHDFLAAGGEFYRTKKLIIEFLRTHQFTVVTRDDHPAPWVRDHVCGAHASV